MDTRHIAFAAVALFSGIMSLMQAETTLDADAAGAFWGPLPGGAWVRRAWAPRIFRAMVLTGKIVSTLTAIVALVASLALGDVIRVPF